MGFSIGKLFSAVATGGLSDVIGGGGSSGGGSSTSSSSTSDAQIGASENGQAVQGGAVGKDNAITLGTDSKLNIGGVELTGPNTGSLVINGAAGVQEVTKTFTEALSQLNDTAATNSEQTLSKLSELAVSKQTDGISSLGKIALGIVALIALAWVASRWNK